MTDTIEVDGVTKTYGDVVALDDISVRIEEGTYHCLLGPNGSGKSTLLRVILDLTQPDSGGVSLPSSAVIGCGFQRPKFYPDLSVWENIDVFASMIGAEDEEWNETVVEKLRLTPALGKEAATLSGGYARKLDLALAMMKQPDFLLLDEPLAALDDVSKLQLLDFLQEYTEMGNTIVASTHYVRAFEEYLDRVTLMFEGERLFDESMGELELGGQSLQSYYVDTIMGEEGDTFEPVLEGDDADGATVRNA
jgi:ABC-2 type transport system ATP-binding protein